MWSMADYRPNWLLLAVKHAWAYWAECIECSVIGSLTRLLQWKLPNFVTKQNFKKHCRQHAAPPFKGRRRRLPPSPPVVTPLLAFTAFTQYWIIGSLVKIQKPKYRTTLTFDSNSYIVLKLFNETHHRRGRVYFRTRIGNTYYYVVCIFMPLGKNYARLATRSATHFHHGSMRILGL